MRVWTREEIEALVERSDLAAMRAVCALATKQTEGELSARSTHESNGVGFNGSHAFTGTNLAHWMTKGRLDGVLRRRTGGAQRFAGVRTPRVEICRYLAKFYAGQLAKIANENEAAKAAETEKVAA